MIDIKQFTITDSDGSYLQTVYAAQPHKLSDDLDDQISDLFAEHVEIVFDYLYTEPKFYTENGAQYLENEDEAGTQIIFFRIDLFGEDVTHAFPSEHLKSLKRDLAEAINLMEEGNA